MTIFEKFFYGSFLAFVVGVVLLVGSFSLTATKVGLLLALVGGVCTLASAWEGFDTARIFRRAGAREPGER